jgi:uncharacterized membrane protein YqjE
MDPRQTEPQGLLGSLKSLVDSLLSSVQDRVALLTLELKEEKFRMIQIFFWINAIVFSGVMTVTFASLALVYMFWESGRIAILGALALFYALTFLAITVAFRRFLARQPQLLAATLQEMSEDRTCTRAEN